MAYESGMLSPGEARSGFDAMEHRSERVGLGKITYDGIAPDVLRHDVMGRILCGQVSLGQSMRGFYGLREYEGQGTTPSRPATTTVISPQLLRAAGIAASIAVVAGLGAYGLKEAAEGIRAIADFGDARNERIGTLTLEARMANTNR